MTGDTSLLVVTTGLRAEQVTMEMPDGRIIIITAQGVVVVMTSLADPTGYQVTLPTVEWHTREFQLADQPRDGGVPIVAYRR